MDKKKDLGFDGKDLDLDRIEFGELEDPYDSIPKEYWKDKSIVLVAVKEHGYALQFTDKSLQKDPDIIKAAKKNLVF
jgi:hypothetical protein